MSIPTANDFNRMGVECLPGHLGVAITHVDATELRAEMPVSTKLMAGVPMLPPTRVFLPPAAMISPASVVVVVLPLEPVMATT